MRHSKASRIIVISAGICLLLAFGCALLGLAVQQGAITLADTNVQLGPLIIVSRGPGSFACPHQANPTEHLCERLSLVARPAVYRIWVFWYTPRRGTQSTRTLAEWIVPVRR